MRIAYSIFISISRPRCKTSNLLPKWVLHKKKKNAKMLSEIKDKKYATMKHKLLFHRRHSKEKKQKQNLVN